jgi:cell division transport system permease protein
VRPGFFVREAFRSLSRNAVPSFAAMATILVTVLVLGVFIPIVQATTGAANAVRDRVVVNVFMDTRATPEDVARVKARLEGTARVQRVEFVSKEQAFRQERKENPIAYDTLGKNPLPDAFKVHPERPDDIISIRNALAPLAPGGGRVPFDAAVDEVKDGEDDTKKILSATRVVKLTVGGLTVLLVIASILLVANTIRLSLYARRREVEVMKLVGATDWFIRWPFVLEGVIVGGMGGLLAILLMAVAKIALIDPAAEGFPLLSATDTMSFGGLVAVLIVASMVVSALGSGLSLRRFLRV